MFVSLTADDVCLNLYVKNKVVYQGKNKMQHPIFVQEEENQDSYVDEEEDFITIRD